MQIARILAAATTAGMAVILVIAITNHRSTAEIAIYAVILAAMATSTTLMLRRPR